MPRKAKIASLIASRMKAIAAKSTKKRNVKGGQGQEYPNVDVKWGNVTEPVTYAEVTNAISVAPDNLLALYNKINAEITKSQIDQDVLKFGKNLIKNTPAKPGQQILATLFGKQDAIKKCTAAIMEIGLLNSLVAGLYGWANYFANDESMKTDTLHVYLNYPATTA